MELKTYVYKHILVSEVRGPLNSRYAIDFRTWFEEQIKKGYRHIAIDFLDIEYVSSTGISSLVEMNQVTQNLKGKLVLFNLGSEVVRLIHFLKLDKKLNIADSAEEALKELSKGGSYKQIQVLQNQKEKAELYTEYSPPKKSEEAPSIIECPECGKKVRVRKTGSYLCPHCEQSFEYS